MIIEFDTLADFLDEIAVEASRIHEKTVRAQTVKAAEQAEGVSYKVAYTVTALVKSDDGQWLLQYYDLAGSDEPNRRTNPHRAGSDQAQAWDSQVKETCDQLGLKKRPGRIEVF